MTHMLASVAGLAEARLAASSGVDIIDLKDPQSGALGALSLELVDTIAKELGEQALLSATIGDLPMQPNSIVRAVEGMSATGVHYVKLGFFPGGDWAGVIKSLARITAQNIRLVAVFFADHPLTLDWLPTLADAGFTGAMLDTADKQRGPLTRIRDLAFLGEFVAAAREAGLMSGLAGSLRAQDIEPLSRLQPDYLGFRGALCGGTRTNALDPNALHAILAEIRSIRMSPELSPDLPD